MADVGSDGFNELIVAEGRRTKALRWNGFGFGDHPDLTEIQYRGDDAPISDRERRTMLATAQDESDRDAIYISSPPNLAWRLEWKVNDQTSVSRHAPMFVAHGGNLFIAAKATPD